MESKVRFDKDVTIDEPFYYFLKMPGTVLDHEFDPPELILKYSDATSWRFPILKDGVLEGIWCVNRTGGEYQTSGWFRRHEPLLTFLDYRDNLKKGFELAELRIPVCGRFWVIHKDLVAKEMIPVDNEAWKTVTGRWYRHKDGWKRGRRYKVTKVVRLIRERVLEHVSLLSKIEGLEPASDSPPNKQLAGAGMLIGNISVKVVDTSVKAVPGAHVIINGFDVGSTSRNGRFIVKRVPPGRHDIVIAKEGYDEFRTDDYPIRPGADTTLTVTIRRSRIEIDLEGNTITLPKDNYRTYPTRPDLYEGQPAFSKTYSKCVPKVNKMGLEFYGCYNDSIVNDTAYVTVVASVKNRSTELEPMCGTFLFVTNYKILNFPLGLPLVRYRLPELKVAGKTFDSANLTCEIKELGYGKAATDTLRFQYRVSRFEKYYGELEVWLLFFYGETDVLWEDSRHFDIGTLRIPIGQPSDWTPLQPAPSAEE